MPLESKRMNQNRIPRGARIAFALLCTLFFAACGSLRQAAQLTPEPVSLDLSNTGLSDITELLSRTDLTTLDLRGNPITIEQYDALSAALPACEILWSVPIGSQRVENDAASAVLSGTVSDLEEALPYLPKLTDVKFTDVTPADYEPLVAFAANHPQLTLRWDVPIGGGVVAQDTVSLDLRCYADRCSNAYDRAGRTAGMHTGAPWRRRGLSRRTEQLSLANGDFRKITFFWNVPLLEDVSVPSDTTEIDLRGYKIPDAAAFSDALALLPKLTYADLCGCKLDNDRDDSLCARAIPRSSLSGSSASQTGKFARILRVSVLGSGFAFPTVRAGSSAAGGRIRRFAAAILKT